MKILKILNIVLIFVLLNVFASRANEAKYLLKEVFDNAKLCIVKKYENEPFLCYIKSSPKKCENDMMNYISSQMEFNVSNKLFLCVATCVDASIYSKTFGECSRNKY